MHAVLISIIGIIAISILIYMLLKKNDIKMILLSLGLIFDVHRYIVG